jgi:sigma-E factor negative regulatory protein RseA
MKSAETNSNAHDQQLNADTQTGQDLSAFMDAETDSLAVDLQSDLVRQNWAIYHVIGEAMREPSAIRPVTSAFAVRMSAALAREPIHGLAQPVVAPAPSGWRWQRAVMAWPGVAVAAAVASVIWVAQPLFEFGQQPDQVATFAQNEPAGNIARVFGEVEPQADYVSAHRQLAGPIGVRQVAFTPGAD